MMHLRLRAEAFAWPLCEPAGLCAAEVRLEPAYFRQSFAARVALHGPDELARDYGERVWTSLQKQMRPGTSASLLHYLQAVAETLLWRDGDQACLKELQLRTQGTNPDEPGQEILFWRFMSLRLPPELLLAGLAAAGGQTMCPTKVCLLPPQLRFEQHTAHLHAHQGQVGNTAQAWAALPGHLNAARDLPRPEGFSFAHAFGETDSEPKMTWTEFLIRAKLAERRLGWHMQHHRSTFGACHSCWADDPEALAGVDELLRGKVAQTDPSLRRQRNHRLLGLLQHKAPCLDASPEVDDQREVQKAPHRLTELLRVGLCQAQKDENRSKPPSALERTLCQLIRARTLFHQALVMDVTLPGLRSFRENYEGPVGRYVDVPEGKPLFQAMRGQHLRIEAFEVRTAPSPKVNSVQAAVQLADTLNEADPQVGWILHLSRSFDKLRLRAEGKPDTDPDKVWSEGVFPELHEKWKVVSSFLTQLQSAHDRGEDPLRILRGIDLCGEERVGPLWMFRPMLKTLRKKLDQLAVEEGVPAPGLTLHCGESFSHLFSGLRAVHEPLLHELWRQGDRLGHALALGIDPEAWVRRRPVVPMRSLERLQDLLWLKEIVAKLRLDLSGGELARIDHECCELKKDLFGTAKEKDPELPEALWKLQPGHFAVLSDRNPTLDGPFGPPEPDRSRLELLHYLSKEGLLSGGPWLEVETAPELDILKRVRTALAGHLARRQVVIEVNPSSNLVVGALLTPLDQPSFWKRGLREDDHGALPLCLSADDPLTFATDLEDEVAYAWAGMVVAGGLPANFARGWLEDGLSVAWRARFSIPRRLSKTRIA